MRGAELVVSFMTLAEMRQGALEANWGPRKRDVLETYLADFSMFHSDSLLCSTWAALRSESTRKGTPDELGRRMDCGHGAGFVGAAGDEQSQGLSPLGQAPACIRHGRITMLGPFGVSVPAPQVPPMAKGVSLPATETPRNPKTSEICPAVLRQGGPLPSRCLRYLQTANAAVTKTPTPPNWMRENPMLNMFTQGTTENPATTRRNPAMTIDPKSTNTYRRSF